MDSVIGAVTSTTRRSGGHQPRKLRESRSSVHNVDEEVNFTPTQPFEVKLDGKPLRMQVDSGCGPVIISETIYLRHWPHKPSLQPADVVLRTWLREQLPVLGSMEVEAHKVRLTVVVAPGDGPPLLGRSWFRPLGIDVIGVYSVTSGNEKWTRHVVFQGGLGSFTGPPVSVVVDPQATPIFRKCRSPSRIKWTQLLTRW